MKLNEVYTDLENFDHQPMDQKPDEGSLYDWVFHFNEYTGLWNAFQRDNYNSYWSDRSASGVISSRSIHTLTEIIQKTGGDSLKIEELLREQ